MRYAQSDGEKVMTVTQKEDVDSRLVENGTYMFCNLVVKEDKAFINFNTVIFSHTIYPLAAKCM